MPFSRSKDIAASKQPRGSAICWGVSIKHIRKQLWRVHEAHLLDEPTGRTHTMQMDARLLGNPQLIDLLETVKTH